MDALQAAGVAFGVVLLAELGDKTQLLLVAMAARGHPLSIWLGAAAGFGLLTVLAVLVGGALERWAPDVLVAWVVAAVFLGYGALLLLRRGNDDQPGPDPRPPRRAGFAAAFLAMSLGELGDKTQLATAALASRGHPLATGFGAWAALCLSAAAAIALGRLLHGRVRPERVRLAAATVFLAVGAYATWQAIELTV